MSDHKLAEALRACLDVLNELPTWSNAGHAVKLGNEALAAHEQQQAGEAVAWHVVDEKGQLIHAAGWTQP